MNRIVAITVVALATALMALPGMPKARAAESRVSLPGLTDTVQLLRDADGVPTIIAANDHDMVCALGYANARDRFFQMDFMRHQASGTLAELVGPPGLQSDVMFRIFGLDRSAAETLPALSAGSRAVLQGYADGVNAFLADSSTQLPPEYGPLELTKASVKPWEPLDSVLLVKEIYFSLSFDESDLTNTIYLSAFQQAGAAGGFDGTKLFFDDVERCAPFDPNYTVPATSAHDESRVAAARRETIESARDLPKMIRPDTIRLAKQFVDAVAQVPSLRAGLERPDVSIGSNWWAVSGAKSATGHAMLANDPHLALPIPSFFCEAHLVVTNDPEHGPMNVTGVQLAGTPGIALGTNERVAWGFTTDPLDLTDFYQEELVTDHFGRPATMFEGHAEPLTVVAEAYRVNNIGDHATDNITDSGIGPNDLGGTVLVSPRRNNGPLLFFDLGGSTTAIGVQYEGARVGRDLDAFFAIERARNMDEFKSAIQYLDQANQNISYADADGNIAYFTGAEVPLREDLQSLGHPDGLPPFLIRDGTHAHKNEWLPRTTDQPGQALQYEILPYSEMPQVVNPAQGYIANANQDPVGTSGDNDPLDQVRAGNGAFYLNFLGYDPGFRMGRINRLLSETLANGGTSSVADMMRIQANNQLLDADIFVPYILGAFHNAKAKKAPAVLKNLAADTRLKKVMKRLRVWDSSTPTGIAEGYDPGDDPTALPTPTKSEIRNSTMATVYAAWRSRMVANTIDAALARVGLGGYRTSSTLALVELRHLLDNFATTGGKGDSGLDFFVTDGASTPEVERDVVILKSLQEALEALAGPAYASAFAGSTNLDDYRWGKLHRIVLAHAFGQPFSVPTAGGFANVSDALPGIAKAGGYDTVDAATHLIRAAGPADYMFSAGPSRRFVVEMTPDGPNAFEILPGGQSGVLTDSTYAGQLGRWLTNQYHSLPFTVDQAKAASVSQQLFQPPNR